MPMKVYLIRHGIAEERYTFAQTGRPDTERPLTTKGKERMHRITEQFAEHESKIDLFLQSPLKRSQQTVDILKKYFKDSKTKTTPHLAPGFSARMLFQCLKENFDKDSIALVGHEPDMGQFLSWLIFQQASDSFPMKRGGIAKLDLYEDNSCYLKWFLRPKFF